MSNSYFRLIGVLYTGCILCHCTRGILRLWIDDIGFRKTKKDVLLYF